MRSWWFGIKYCTWNSPVLICLIYLILQFICGVYWDSFLNLETFVRIFFTSEEIKWIRVLIVCVPLGLTLSVCLKFTWGNCFNFIHIFCQITQFFILYFKYLQFIKLVLWINFNIFYCIVNDSVFFFIPKYRLSFSSTCLPIGHHHCIMVIVKFCNVGFKFFIIKVIIVYIRLNFVKFLFI